MKILGLLFILFGGCILGCSFSKKEGLVSIETQNTLAPKRFKDSQTSAPSLECYQDRIYLTQKKLHALKANRGMAKVSLPYKLVECLEVGKKIKLVSIENREVVASSKIGRINTFDSYIKTLPDNDVSGRRCRLQAWIYYYGQKSIFSSSADIFLSETQWRPNVDLNFFNQVNVRHHTYIENVPANSLRSEKKDKFFIVDLRQGVEFKKNHIPNATNIPLSLPPKTYPVRLTSCELRLNSGEFSWDMEKLPADKRVRILIYSDNPRDLLTEYASHILALNGYINIFRIWDGMTGWIRKPVQPPSFDHPRISLITATELSKVLEQSEVVDLRYRDSLNDGKIVNSSHLYYEHSSATGNVDSFSVQYFISNGDKWNFKSIPRNKGVVLYGWDSGDWRPLKAAIWLASKGYDNIFWYREGMADWHSKNLLDSKKFPIEFMRNSYFLFLFKKYGHEIN